MPRRTDANQQQQMAELRALGFLCTSTHTLGKGAPDYLVSGYHRNLNVKALLWVECKSAKGKLTSSEKKFHLAWQGHPVIVARCAEDVLRWFGWDGRGAGIL
jgi:hypothetical protein